MAVQLEWIVPLALVRDADRPAAAGLPLPAPERAARVAVLRRRVFAGFYASDAMMDALARVLVDVGAP